MPKSKDHLLSKELLETELFIKNKSITQFSKEINISHPIIVRNMKKYGLEKPPQKLNLINQKFGRGVVIEEIGHCNDVKSKRIYWKLICDCGNEYRSDTQSLKNGNTKSCGCYSKELVKERQSTGFKDLNGTYFGSIKQNAKNSNKEFNITIEYAWNLFEKQNKKCKFTGVDLIFTDRCQNICGNASLDRIDSTVGYVEGNVQWVHKEINNMKSDRTDHDFIEWCRKVVSHQESVSPK